MATARTIGSDFKERLNLRTSPLGLHHAPARPEGAGTVREPGQGCIMPLVLAASKGRSVSFDRDATGWPCSAFYLGYKDWIFPGIERYLSHGPLPGRECERFVRTPGQVEEYLKDMRFEAPAGGATVIQPLEFYDDQDKPEVAIFFANADQLSALVFLLYYDAPQADDRVVARFASACAAVISLPLALVRSGERKAVWGMHDISARTRMPKELMTMAMPYGLCEELHAFLDESFVTTSQWRKLAARA